MVAVGEPADEFVHRRPILQQVGKDGPGAVGEEGRTTGGADRSATSPIHARRVCGNTIPSPRTMREN
jgi:hypothetical protein